MPYLLNTQHTFDDWKKELGRPASILKIGGFRPTHNPAASQFGRVTLGTAGESWPHWRGKPLWPLCQLNIGDAPFVPEPLADIVLLTLFIAEEYWDSDDPWLEKPGEGDSAVWCLRTYSTIDGLVPVVAPEHNSWIEPFECQWEKLDTDYPTYDLMPDDMPEPMQDRFSESEETSTANGTKLGGWPACIQSEPWWDYSPQGSSFEYVLQLDSDEKANWMWGDMGNAFFARQKDNPNKWAFDWQCH